MPVDVIMPALGMAQDTGKVIRWFKADGAPVMKGEPLVEVETDKVTVEIEAPADGTLVGLRAADGEEVPVGEAIAVVLLEGEQDAGVGTRPPPTAAEVTPIASDAGAASTDSSKTTGDHATRPRRVLASPKARRLAAARGIDLEEVSARGQSGPIVAADLDAVLEDSPSGTPSTPAEGVPVSRVWCVMADRTSTSWQSVPHIWLRREVDASRLHELHIAARATGDGAVSLTDLLVRAVAEALRRHPRVNSSWHDGTIVAGSGINVAIAVATEDGLVAPVIHGADGLDLAQIAARREALVAAAREGSLRLDDLRDGTFTISNLGMYGVDEFDGIVNAPQAALLAVGRVRDRVVAVEGRPEVRPMLRMSVAFDHRVVDGARGAEFLDALAALIEDPSDFKADASPFSG